MRWISIFIKFGTLQLKMLMELLAPGRLYSFFPNFQMKGDRDSWRKFVTGHKSTVACRKTGLFCSLWCKMGVLWMEIIMITSKTFCFIISFKVIFRKEFWIFYWFFIFFFEWGLFLSSWGPHLLYTIYSIKVEFETCSLWGNLEDYVLGTCNSIYLQREKFAY